MNLAPSVTSIFPADLDCPIYRQNPFFGFSTDEFVEFCENRTTEFDRLLQTIAIVDAVDRF